MNRIVIFIGIMFLLNQNLNAQESKLVVNLIDQNNNFVTNAFVVIDSFQSEMTDQFGNAYFDYDAQEVKIKIFVSLMSYQTIDTTIYIEKYKKGVVKLVLIQNPKEIDEVEIRPSKYITDESWMNADDMLMLDSNIIVLWSGIRKSYIKVYDLLGDEIVGSSIVLTNKHHLLNKGLSQGLFYSYNRDSCCEWRIFNNILVKSKTVSIGVFEKFILPIIFIDSNIIIKTKYSHFNNMMDVIKLSFDTKSSKIMLTVFNKGRFETAQHCYDEVKRIYYRRKQHPELGDINYGFLPEESIMINQKEDLLFYYEFPNEQNPAFALFNTMNRGLSLDFYNFGKFVYVLDNFSNGIHIVSLDDRDPNHFIRLPKNKIKYDFIVNNGGVVVMGSDFNLYQLEIKNWEWNLLKIATNKVAFPLKTIIHGNNLFCLGRKTPTSNNNQIFKYKIHNAE